MHNHYGHNSNIYGYRSMNGMGITEDQIAENKAAIERAKTALLTFAGIAATVYFLTRGYK